MQQLGFRRNKPNFSDLKGLLNNLNTRRTRVDSVYFVTCPKQSLEMEVVVLQRVAFLEYFCPKQGQDFKPPVAPLYPIMGQVPPLGQRCQIYQFLLLSLFDSKRLVKRVPFFSNYERYEKQMPFHDSVQAF